MSETDQGRPRNEGPRRGPHNRRAILAAAAEVFAEKGYDAPLYEVARRAGVGQGSLYRHFNGRPALIYALYAANVEALEARARATAQRPDAFFELLGLLVEQVVDSLGYADALSRLPQEHVEPYIVRVQELFAAPVRRGQEAGLLGGRLTQLDLPLVVQMLYGVLRGTPPEERAQVVGRTLELLDLAGPAGRPPGRAGA